MAGRLLRRRLGRRQGRLRQLWQDARLLFEQPGPRQLGRRRRAHHRQHPRHHLPGQRLLELAHQLDALLPRQRHRDDDGEGHRHRRPRVHARGGRRDVKADLFGPERRLERAPRRHVRLAGAARRAARRRRVRARRRDQQGGRGTWPPLPRPAPQPLCPARDHGRGARRPLVGRRLHPRSIQPPAAGRARALVDPEPRGGAGGQRGRARAAGRPALHG